MACLPRKIIGPGPIAARTFAVCFGRDEIRVGAVGLGRRELEPSSDVARRARPAPVPWGLGAMLQRTFHLRQVFLHVAVGLVVVTPRKIVHDRLVTDADSEQETAAPMLPRRWLAAAAIVIGSRAQIFRDSGGDD